MVFPVVDGEELVRVVGDVEGGWSGLAVVLTGLSSTNNTEVEFKRQINSPGYSQIFLGNGEWNQASICRERSPGNPKEWRLNSTSELLKDR